MMDTQVLPKNNINNNINSPSVLPREIEAAIEKHDRRQARVERQQGWGATTGGKALTKRYLSQLSEAISASLTLTRDPRDPLVDLIRVVAGLDPDVITLCGLRTVLHAIASKRMNFVDLLNNLGSDLEGECWAAALTHHNPRLAARVAKASRTRQGSIKSKRKAAQAHAAKAKKDAFEQRDWDATSKVQAGGWLLDLVVNGLTEVFSWIEIDGQRYVELTADAMTIVDEALYNAIERNPVFFPSTTPPIPWTKAEGCGPNDPRMNYKIKFVRSHHQQTQAAVRAAIKDGSMQPALDAVNGLQAVPWKINQRILDVLHEVDRRGYVVAGVPLGKDIPLPAKMPDAVWKTLDEAQQRLSKMKRGEIHMLNRSAKSDRIQFAEDMKMADELATVDQFYTAMNCDWRGRVYGTVHFNFQREDRVRALFLFRDGEPIGEEGLYWLKVHVANCGAFDKIDKQPFDERVKWIDENMGYLRDIVANPLWCPTEEQKPAVWWTDADKPFMFLASILELVACLEEGVSRITCLPVSFDGSCSGLQHLSAMTRATEGSLVNLTPSDLPQDIYANVAELVQQRITADLDHEPEDTENEDQVKVSDRIRALARLSLDYGIGRGEVKRNVMTYAYSSKKFGMACQLQVDLMSPLAREVLEGKYEEHPFHPYQDGDMERPSAASRYLAGHIFESIETVVRKPSEAMKFLQKLARAMAHEAKPLRWTTPVGLPWINRYHDSLTKRVTLWLQEGGVSVLTRTTLANGYETAINKDKAANGVAPNFVHALDASHLLLVANAARSEGISSIATVHDSFGCLPSQAARFRQIIVEQFLQMYETNDVLAQVRVQASCDLTHNNWHMLPDAIEYGALNLKDILNAQFAFA